MNCHLHTGAETGNLPEVPQLVSGGAGGKARELSSPWALREATLSRLPALHGSLRQKHSGQLLENNLSE